MIINENGLHRRFLNSRVLLFFFFPFSVSLPTQCDNRTCGDPRRDQHTHDQRVQNDRRDSERSLREHLY